MNSGRIVVVLGMHRSGTSAVTRALPVMGVELGDHLMPAAEGNNKKGFWEDMDVVAINIELLACLGRDWSTLEPILDFEWDQPAVDLLRLRAVQLLRQRLSSTKLYGFKDPRTARLLPFWKSVFTALNVEVGYIVACRHPMSVVNSLEKRDFFSREKCYLLWFEHMLESTLHAIGGSYVMVDYDLLLENPERELARVSDALYLEFSPEGELFAEYKSQFLEQDLRHHQFEHSDFAFDRYAPPQVIELYGVLHDLASGRVADDSVLAGVIVRLKDVLSRNHTALRYASLCEAKVRGLEEQVEEIAKLENQVVSLNSQVVTLNSQVVTLDSHVDDLNRKIAERDAALADLTAGLSDERYRGERTAAALREVYESTSWRSTAVLRWLGRSLRLVKNGTEFFCWAIKRHSIVKLIGRGAVVLARSGLGGVRRELLLLQSQRQIPLDIDEKQRYFADSVESLLIEEGVEQFVPLVELEREQNQPVSLICFYLPQFHPIAENNEWWGEGFTEWTNVQPAQPQFKGHYQPHEPGELGYYSLLDPVVQRRQVELAKQYGVGGFCFYFYWFAGRRLLEQPILNYLDDEQLELPFCLCWANENWSRRWDGLDKEVLIAQNHSAADDLEFIEYVSRYMQDDRYIKVDGKPLLVVYRPSLLPSASKTAQRWRRWCRENGIGEIYLAYTQSFEMAPPNDYGFDGAIEFPPNSSNPPDITSEVPVAEEFSGRIYDWRILPQRSEHYEEPGYTLFRSACPSWDNTARRKKGGTIFLGSKPVYFQQWLKNAIDHTLAHRKKGDRLVFINAWNEWAEGAHLEPDARYGYAWLEAARMAQLRCALLGSRSTTMPEMLAIVIHAFYFDVFEEILKCIDKNLDVDLKLYVTTPDENRQRVEEALNAKGVRYTLSVVPNRGRDVAPFLSILHDVIRDGHSVLLKVHTKKSVHRSDGEVWRKDLFEKLLSRSAIRRAMEAFSSRADLGVIGADGHVVPMDFYWGSNAKTTRRLAERMGVSASELMELTFVAGTMFFARIEALRPLGSLGLRCGDFEEEAGQVDGTLAHAVERAISASAVSAGLTVESFGEDGVSTNYPFAERQTIGAGGPVGANW